MSKPRSSWTIIREIFKPYLTEPERRVHRHAGEAKEARNGVGASISQIEIPRVRAADWSEMLLKIRQKALKHSVCQLASERELRAVAMSLREHYLERLVVRCEHVAIRSERLR